MRRISPELAEHLAGEVTTLATCYRITRVDGIELGFTDHDESLTIDSLEYDSISGFTPTTIESKSDMSVDNMEIEGINFPSKITEADLLAGIYDYAEVEIFLVNYEDLNSGKKVLKRGKLGEVILNKQIFRAEIRGLTQHLSLVLGTVYSPTCQAILGDSSCKVNLATCTVKAQVTKIIDRQTFIAKTLTQKPGYFSGGEVKWLSGDNLSSRMEVKEFADSMVTLVLPMRAKVQIGDVFSIVAGCDKLRETCISKFNNILNFQGFPDVPGVDKLLSTAGTSHRARS